MSEQQCEKYLELLKKFDLCDSSGELRSDLDNDVKAFIREVNSICVNNTTDKDEKQRLKAILDSTPCTISWFDRDLTYRGVNKALAEVCQLSSEDFVGQKIGFQTKNKHLEHLAEALFESEEGKCSQEIDTYIGKEQKKFWISGSKFDKGSQALFVGLDITEIKNMEDHITFTEKLSSLGEMVAGIVHEVNNPLMLIDANVKKLQKTVEDEEALSRLGRIQDTTKKISKIIQGVKSFVRQGKNEPHTEENLLDIINDALIICESKFKKQDVRFHMDEPDFDPIYKCNMTQVFQVFVNLMTNAIDALGDSSDKWIKVSFEENDDAILVRFTDSGAGIPEDIQKEIFNSFFTTKEAGAGTGLGLSLCKKIMTEHHGDIEIDQNSSNTCFLITFSKKEISEEIAA